MVTFATKSRAGDLKDRYVVQDSIPDILAKSLTQRYGSSNVELVRAWQILLASGYSFQTVSFIDTTKMTLLHAFFTSDKGQAMQTSDQQRILLPALDLFNRCIGEFKSNTRFVADLNSLTAECLNRYLNQLEIKCAHSLAEKDKNGYQKWSDKFLKTAVDFNNLLKYIPETTGRLWVPRIPAQKKQWMLLINYGQECLLRRNKFNPEFITRQPLKTITGQGVSKSIYSSDQAGSLALSERLYGQYNDTDIGFE